MSNRGVIVTGAGSGVGAAMVREFADNGDRVAAVDIHPEGTAELARELGADVCLAVEADVGDEAAVATGVARAAEFLGGVDVLCNNAGMLDDYFPVLDTSPSLWQQILGTNLTGPFLMSRAVLPAMVERQAGVILNTASISAFIAGGGGAAYTASKHGLLGLTRQMAFDYGRYNIRVNAICPGPVKTGMTAHLLTPEGRQDHVDAAIASIPAGRWAEPSEIAKMAVYLASDAASFAHGAAFVIDGGWTVS